MRKVNFELMSQHSFLVVQNNRVNRDYLLRRCVTDADFSKAKYLFIYEGMRLGVQNHIVVGSHLLCELDRNEECRKFKWFGWFRGGARNGNK